MKIWLEISKMKLLLTKMNVNFSQKIKKSFRHLQSDIAPIFISLQNIKTIDSVSPLLM